MQNNTNKNVSKTNNWLLWSAVVLSIASLLLSFMAYTETGKIEMTLKSYTNQQINQAENSLSFAEAQVKLKALQAKIIAGDAIEDSQQEIEDIRMSLKSAYNDSTDKSKEELAGLEKEVDQLEIDIRENSAAALKNIARIIEQLENKIQP